MSAAATKKPKRFRWGLFIFLGIVSLPILFFAYYGWAYPDIKKRYLLEVTFSVDGKNITGSSVQKLSISNGPGFLSNDSTWSSLSVKGQAAIIDLSDRGTVYALIHGPHSAENYLAFPYLLIKACDLRHNQKMSLREYIRLIGRFQGKCDVPRNLYPMLVKFENEADPLSVQFVDPVNLESTLGPGVEIVNVSMTITNEPLSTGIAERLVWLKKLKGRDLAGGKYQIESPFSLSTRHFISKMRIDSNGNY